MNLKKIKKKREPYKAHKEYYLTIKSNNKYYRLLKFEQGQDKSFYVKWNLSLSKNKDGAYNHRSYISYHNKYDVEKCGYRVHQYGCGGNRIKKSINYRKKFITDYASNFFEYNFDKMPDSVIIKKPFKEDIVFKIDDFSNCKILLFSDKRNDLLKKDFENMISKKVDLESYFLIVSLFKKSL